MRPKDTKQLNINIRTDLLEKIDKYRFKRMFESRSAAIEHLLDIALKQNPEKPAAEER